LHVFELQDGATVAVCVPALTGDTAMTFDVRRAGQRIDVRAERASAPWRVLLRGITAVRSVDAGAAEANELGTLLISAAGATSLTVQLPVN